MINLGIVPRFSEHVGSGLSPKTVEQFSLYQPAKHSDLLAIGPEPLASPIDRRGRITGSRIELDAATASAYVERLTNRDIAALAPSDRAELVRLIRFSNRVGLNGSMPDSSSGAMEKLFETYRLSPERTAADTRLAQNFARALKMTVNLDDVRARWPSMSADERQSLMVRIMRLQASTFGFESVAIRTDRPLVTRGARAEYDFAQNEMRLRFDGSPDSVGTFDDAVTSVFHEGVHAYQDMQITAYDHGTLTLQSGGADLPMLWINSFQRGYLAVSSSDYIYNPLEQEAYRTTDAMRAELGLPPDGPYYPNL
jgi:hypothetical protein